MGQDQDDETTHSMQNYSNNTRIGSNGRPTKKQRQKKVPQRGLGVAELERIRLEEQQHHHLQTTRPPMESNQTSCISSTTSSTFQKHPHRQSFDHLSSQKKKLTNSENMNNKYGSISNHYNSSSSIPLSTQTCWQNPPEKRGGNCDSDMTMPPWNLTSSSNSSAFPLWPEPLHHRVEYQHHRQPLLPPSSSVSSSTSSKMNVQVPKACSRTSSSTGIRNHQMEAFSNKSYCSHYNQNDFSTALEEGDHRNKLAITAQSSTGIKRPYHHHHHQDNNSIGGNGNDSTTLTPPAAPHFMYHHNKTSNNNNNSNNNKQLLPSVVHHHHHHESPSSFNFGSGPVFNFSSHPPAFFRDGCSSWNMMRWPSDSRESDGMGFSSDYLTANTLAPTTEAATTTGGGARAPCGSSSNNNFKVLNDPNFHFGAGKKFEIDPPSSSSSLHSYYQHHHHHHQVKGRLVADQGTDWPQSTALLMKDTTLISSHDNDGNHHPDESENLDLNLKL